MRFLPLMCLLGLLGLAPGLLPRSAIAAEQVVSLRVHQGAEPQINTLITTLPTHHQSLSDGQGLWHSSALSAAGDHRFVFNAALSKGVEHLWPVDGHITGPRLPPMRSQTLQFIDLNTNQPSHTTIFEWTVRSDDRHCYLLARWSDDDHDNVWQTEGVTRIDQMRIDFDDGSDGILGSADDRRYVVPAWNGTLYRDSNHTDIDDAIGDGKG